MITERSRKNRLIPLRWLALIAASRPAGVALALYAFGTNWLTGWHGMNFAMRGLLDEPAHLATALITLGALVRFRGSLPDPRFVGTMLICSVAIDLDHLPAEFGSNALTAGTPRLHHDHVRRRLLCRRSGAPAPAGTGAERRGHGPVPGHRCTVPQPRLRQRARPGLRHARPAGQAGHPGPERPGLLQGPGRSGEAPARAMFTADAAHGDIPAAPDDTALELFNDPVIAEEFVIPAPGARPLLRLVGLLHSGTRRWRAAVISRYLDGENALADQLQDAYGPGQLNLVGRGFFSMDRWLRFSGTGARLLWRVKNGAKCVPFKTLKILLLRLRAGPAARETTNCGRPTPIRSATGCGSCPPASPGNGPSPSAPDSLWACAFLTCWQRICALPAPA